MENMAKAIIFSFFGFIIGMILTGESAINQKENIINEYEQKIKQIEYEKKIEKLEMRLEKWENTHS